MENEMILENYGYNSLFKEKFGEYSRTGLMPGRVTAQHKSLYRIVTKEGEVPGDISGKYRYTLDSVMSLPAVGDFVAVEMSADRGVIHGLVERKSLLYRKGVFDGQLQPLCANLDYLFICMSLNRDFNLSRLERYVILARESGAEAVVVLTKADECEEWNMQKEICMAVFPQIPIHAVSSFNGMGMENLSHYFSPGKTVAAVGSSGVGKSTLINAISGEILMETGEIREDDQRGRHTTTHRQLILLKNGGLYVDTPGIRTVGLADADEGISSVYADIEELMTRCRFRDCSHTKEAGCAVLNAIQSGSLERDRYEKYLRMKREAAYYNDKAAYMRERSKFFKQISKRVKSPKK